MKRKRLRASFTVEAAFLFPILILLAAFILQTAIALYGTVEEASAVGEEIREIDGVQLFLNASGIDELKKEIMDED